MDTKRQISESFRLSALLSFSGGLQDAYTYNMRGHVFANAQTGNVVLMSQHFMQGHWAKGVQYLFPLIAFALGILISEQIGYRYKHARKIHWRQIILIMEIILLGIVGFLPRDYDMLANIIVSLSCAMQVQSFRTFHGYGYASTMCIGNLRSGTESLSEYLRDRNQTALSKAINYYGIILIFAAGAGVGGVLSKTIGNKTIWISVVLLLIDCLMMIRSPKTANKENAPLTDKNSETMR